MKNKANAERKSERELIISRLISGSSQLVFEAWARPEVFRKWWVPKSAPITLESCEMDVRTGGKYRLTFSMDSQRMEFFGKYLEVIPSSRLVWTNEEGGENAAVITTVTFEELDGATRVTVHDRYPSKQALDEALASESTGALPEQLEQLEQLIVSKGK
jgi:uncharacterized protein YndB with AHSA1/START domain